MAEQFDRMEAVDGGLGPTLGKLLVEDRNAAAIKVFQKELAKGHKRIAVFYGAAHMPDFERRLKDEFGMLPQKARWLTAWDLTREAPAKKDPLSDLLRGLLK